MKKNANLRKAQDKERANDTTPRGETSYWLPPVPHRLILEVPRSSDGTGWMFFAEVEEKGVYKRQMGPMAAFAYVVFKIEPDDQFVFVNTIEEPELRYFVWGVVDGLKQFAHLRAEAGVPITAIRVTLTDLHFHDVDSKRADFCIATQMALTQACERYDVLVPHHGS